MSTGTAAAQLDALACLVQRHAAALCPPQRLVVAPDMQRAIGTGTTQTDAAMCSAHRATSLHGATCALCALPVAVGRNERIMEEPSMTDLTMSAAYTSDPAVLLRRLCDLVEALDYLQARNDD